MVVLSSSGSSTLVGILKGGGLDYAKLYDDEETLENKPGVWMRISSFRGWISGVITTTTTPTTKTNTSPTTPTEGKMIHDTFRI